MKKQIASLIIDDEPDARDGLEVLIKTYLPEIEILDKAENAEEAIRQVVKYAPDLIFLDIKMPGKDGFYVAEELEKLGMETTIIFITAYDQYAINAIKHAAFDFILKPVDPDELVKAVSRYKNLIEKESLKVKIEKLHACLLPNRLKFSTQTGFVMINPGEIIYIGAGGNYTDLYLADGQKVTVTQQIGQIEPQLDSHQFVRISRSHIINIRYLKEFNRKKKVVLLKTEEPMELKVSLRGMKRLKEV